MAIMANVTPIEIKPSTTSQAVGKKNSSSSDKMAAGFVKVLNNQADKNTKEDVNTKDDTTTTQLMSEMMGLNLRVTTNVIMQNQSNDKIPDNLLADDGGQFVNANDQLTDLIGKNNIRLDVATGMNTSQNQLAALLTKGADVNTAVDSNNTSEFTMQLQELLKNKQLTEQAQASNSSSNQVNVTTNKALLETVVVNNNGVVKNNSPLQFDSKKAAQIQTGAITSELTQLVDTADVRPVTISPSVVNAVNEMANESEGNTALLDGKVQVSVDSILPTQTENSSDTFAGLLNQQVVKNENHVTISDAKEPLQQPAKDSYHVASQIVDQARLISGQKNTEMIIQLKPEHLGELTFKVTVESGVVSASFHSNNSEVRNIIEASLPQLKQELSNQGLKIENVGVYAGLGEFFSNGQRESQRKPEVKVQNKKIEEDFLEALDSTSTIESNSEGSGVDYRI